MGKSAKAFDLLFVPADSLHNPKADNAGLTGRYYRIDAVGRRYLVCEQASDESGYAALARCGYRYRPTYRDGRYGYSFSNHSDGTLTVTVWKIAQTPKS